MWFIFNKFTTCQAVHWVHSAVHFFLPSRLPFGAVRCRLATRAPLIASVEVFHPITYSRWDNERWGLVMKIVYYPRAVEHKSTVNENTLIFVLYNNIDYMLFVIWISLGIEWKSSTHLTNVIKSSQHKEKFLSRADFPLTGNIFDIA